MALSDITKKITDDAKTHVDRIRSEVREKVEVIDTETQKKVSEHTEAFEVELTQALMNNQQKVTATAEHEARLKVESAKQLALTEIFIEARAHISHLVDELYIEIFSRVATRLPKNVSGSVVVPTGRLEESKKVLKEFNGLTDMKEQDIAGGFIITSDTAVYNLSLDQLLKEVKEKHDIELADLLFA